MTVKLNFWDANEDGTVTLLDVFTILRHIVYIALACYVIIVEGQNPEVEVYSDMKIGLIVCSSFGAVILEKFLSLKFK